MTVVSLDSQAILIGDGMATTFITQITLDEDADLKVYLFDTVGKTTTLLTRLTDYTISDQVSDTGVTINYPVSGDPLETTEQLLIIRETSDTLVSDFVLDRGYDPEATASEFSRLTRLTQELRSLVNRCFRLGTPSDVAALDNTNPADRSGKMLIFNTAGDGVELGPDASDIAAAQTSATTATTKAAEAAASAAAAAAAENGILKPQGQWTTATDYVIGDVFYNLGSSYDVIEDHTSGVFATDLAASKMRLFAEKGAAGAGTGDVLAANNGTDFTDFAALRANIGVVDATTTTKGLVEKATSQEGLDGTADKYPDAATVIEMIEDNITPSSGFPVASYTSSQITLTSRSVITVNHALAAAPVLLDFSFTCIQDNNGFVVGDTVVNASSVLNAAAFRGFYVYVPTGDVNNLKVVCGDSLRFFNAAANTEVQLSFSQWRLIVKIWK